MKILSIYYTDKPGGLCQRLYRLLNYASQQEHQVYFLSLDKPPSTVSFSVEWVPIAFFLKRRSGIFFWISFSLWAPLVSFYYCWKLRPDRIFVFNAYYSFLVASGRKLFGIKVIVFLRALTREILQSTLPENGKKPGLVYQLKCWSERWGLQSADRVVCITRHMAAEAEKKLAISSEKIEVLPNNISLGLAAPMEYPKFAQLVGVDPLAPKPFFVLCSGVIDRRKHMRFAIEAWKNQLQKKPNIEAFLLIAGEGPEKEELQDYCRSHQLNSIKFLGWVTDLKNILLHVDLVVHPSRHEGMSNSILEALGSGVPVICSDIPEHRELMESSEALFPIESAEALSHKLLELISNRSQLQSLKEVCAQRAEKYSFDWEQEALKQVLAD